MDIDFLKSAAAAVLDYFLPRTCIVCGKILDSAEIHLCRHCKDDLPHTYYWMLRNNPMADRFNDLIQKGLEKGLEEDLEEGLGEGPEEGLEEGLDGPGNGGSQILKENYAYAAALFFYRAESDYRHITQRIKYNGDIGAGTFFGNILGEKLASGTLFQDVDLIIPVPLHWRRQWERGYNQAQVIAEGISARLGAPVRSDILIRSRSTKTQTRLSIEEKSLNVKNAFGLHKRCRTSIPPELTGIRHILLVDDVFTTGSTALACFTALRTVFPPSVRISVATLGFVGGA